MERTLEEESVKSALSGTNEGICHRCTLATRPDKLISFWAFFKYIIQMWVYACGTFQSARKQILYAK
jgi:hypothetical protein